MRKGPRQWQLTAALITTAAVIWMFAPTLPMTWAPSPTERLITWHSWADSIAFGYLLLPPLVLAAGLIAAIAGWVEVARRRATLLPVAVCVLALVLGATLLGIGGLHIMVVIPVALLLIAAGLYGHVRRLTRVAAA